MRCEFALPEGFGEQVNRAIVGHLHPDKFRVGFIPSGAEISKLLQVALWASVLRDEDRPALFSISVRPQGDPPSAIYTDDPSAPSDCEH
jgi:hypothetical protein